MYNPLYSSSEREANRIMTALRFLRNEGLISEEIRSEAARLTEEMKKLRNDHFSKIKEEKDEEAQKARDEINANVKAWKDKWYMELEKEN